MEMMTTTRDAVDTCALCPLKLSLLCSTTCSTSGIRNSLVEAATRWTFATDASGRILSTTSGFSASTGIPLKYLYDHPDILNIVTHPDDLEALLAKLFQAIVERKEVDVMFRQWHAPSRQYLLHHLEAQPHFDEERNLVGYHGTVSIVEHLA